MTEVHLRVWRVTQLLIAELQAFTFVYKEVPASKS